MERLAFLTIDECGVLFDNRIGKMDVRGELVDPSGPEPWWGEFTLRHIQ